MYFEDTAYLAFCDDIMINMYTTGTDIKMTEGIKYKISLKYSSSH